MAAKAVTGMTRIAALTAAAASLAACASLPSGPPQGGAYAPQKIGQPYQVGGIWYVPREQPNYDEVGTASWYGEQFHLKTTANGEIFDMNAVTAAHTTLPLPCIVEVTNLDNGRRLRVRVNDRGPFVGGRIIDLSREAARELGYERAGLARVRVRYVSPAPLLGPEAGVRQASLRTAPAAPVGAPASRTYQQAQATLRWRDQAAVATSPTPAPAPVTARAAAAPAAGRYPFLASTVAPPAAVSVQSLPELPAAPGPEGEDAAPPAAAARPAPIWPAATRAETAAGYRIQAGAFSEEAKARRVAAQLSTVGEAVVEPVQRNGVTLYRVVLPAPADELQAYNLRHRISEIGFEDARVVPLF